MALDKTALKTGLMQLHQDMMTRDVDSAEEYAERLSTLLESFVKSGAVKAGIPVSTTGSSSAQSGATTGLGQII